MRPGGRVAYYNVLISEELSPEKRREARKAGFTGAYTPARQQGLLRSAGFENIRETDVTDEYLRVLRALREANERHERGLRKAMGAEVYEGKQTRRRESIAGIERGVIRRSLLVAARPVRRR